MTSARVSFIISDDLYERTGQRVLLTDAHGLIRYEVDRAELRADPDGVFAVMGSHGTALCAGGRYEVPEDCERTG